MSRSIKFAVRKALSARATAFTTATVLFGFATSVSAQDAAPSDTMPEGAESIEEVVVTGFRASLNAAIEAKKDQNGSIDMIVAEDIADFPDLNLAESLQRVPGVVIARDAGEGRQISVRGLGPQFTRVRINGVEAMSANGSTDASGGTNRGRNFDFNTFASELFNNITVRKTASADTEEGSLGATVDLRTGRPFDYDGFTLAGGLQLGYNDLSEKSDPRATFLISNTFADGKFGALMSVAYTKRKLQDEGSSTVRWQNGGNIPGAATRTSCVGPGRTDPNAPLPLLSNTPATTPNTNTNCFLSLDGAYAASGSTATLDQINDAFHPRIPRYDIYQHEQERLGVTASLQFAPSDATKVSLDALYAKYDAERSEIFLEVPTFSSAGNGMAPVLATPNINDVTVAAAEIDGTNSLVYGVFNNVDVRSEARFDELSTEFTQVSIDLEHQFGDTLRVNGLLGFAEANHENPTQTTLLFDAFDVDGYTYDFRDNKRLPLITFGNNRLGTAFDPTATTMNNPGGTAPTANYQLTQIRLRPQATINSFQTVSFNVEWDASESWKFKAGPDWKNYIFKSAELRRASETNVTAAAATPIGNYSTTIDFDASGLNVPAGTATSWLIPDFDAAVETLDLNNRTLYPLVIGPVLGNNNRVEEDDIGGFVQADFKYELGSHTLRGNLGVRYVETEQTSDGYASVNGTPVLTTITRKYDDVLPSLNLVFDISDSLLIRAGAAKVLTRPNLGQITPGSTVTVSGNNRTANIGNPALDPFRAKAYDLGIEWYFAPESLVSLALFRKDVDSFVSTLRNQIPFTGNPYGLPDSLAIQACGNQCTPASIFDFTVPVNTEGGTVDGYEVSYQQPFSFLPGVWSNFGAIVNYTHVESEIEYLTATGATTISTVKDDLTGLSKDAYNATLYFDNKTFSARISAAYRSDYLTTVPGRNLNDVEGTAATMNVDFSSSYNINDNFTISLEALNLTDEVQDQWVDSTGDRLSYYHHQGRQLFLGARFKY